ncbi:MAG: DUF4349 domain-containing protein [Solirubrobacterales bacterium]
MRLSDEQIGAELRALRPAPDKEFAARLDERVAALPAQPEAAARGRNVHSAARTRILGPRWKRLVPAAAVLAVTVAVVAVALSNRGSETTSLRGSVDQAAPSLGTGAAAPRESVSPSTAEPIPPIPNEQLKPGRERVQERSASLTLSTDPGKVDDVSDGVIDVTDRYDGIVSSSQVNTAGGSGRASFDLRIPARNLQAALADLSDLAHVSSRNEGTLDITSTFVSAQERFADARAAVDRLLDQLARADSPAEIAAIREQLRLARQELAVARAQLAGLKQRADFSRLSVTVLGDADGGSWSIGDAADDAVSVLEAIGGAALITLAVLVPLALLTALGWAGTRELRRRRREAPLDR